jgi:hypothetical protein
MMRSAAIDSPTPLARETGLSRSTLMRLVALTPAVLLIHGYHPFSDDAGIYVAGVRKLLDPSLYRPDAAFVLANTRLSLFAHAIAATVRVTHLPLAVMLLIAHLASIFLYLLGCWCVASHVFARSAERWTAVLLAVACFTLPAAGTALVLMDPYVTARSFSTPLALFAVAAVLERRWGRAAVFLVLMGAVHPLMMIYAAALVVLYAVADAGTARWAAVVGVFGVAAVGVFALALRHVPVSHAYFEAMHSGDHWFVYPAQWRWYEDFGLIAPLALFGWAIARLEAESRVRRLCVACVALGASSTAASFLFVHASGPYLLARLQLLRSFQIIYALGVLLLGGLLGRMLGRGRARWALALMLAVAAGGLFAAQRANYPFSAHIEWPWARPRNPWAKAYVWIRENAPANAVFAADPGLVFRDGVDMQGFRATAERSMLADDKDQGVVAAVDPSLAATWAAQRDAQLGVETMTDAERIRRLRPLGATWLLLPSSAKTNFPCPYRNAAAKVCRIGGLPVQRFAPPAQF